MQSWHFMKFGGSSGDNGNDSDHKDSAAVITTAYL